MGSVPIFAILGSYSQKKTNPDPVAIAIGIVQLITCVNGPLHVTCDKQSSKEFSCCPCDELTDRCVYRPIVPIYTGH